jgi:hypothetical protein
MVHHDQELKRFTERANSRQIEATGIEYFSRSPLPSSKWPYPLAAGDKLLALATAGGFLPRRALPDF